MPTSPRDREESRRRYENAEAHCGRRRYDLALPEAEAALRADPDNAEAHSLLGVCLSVAGRMEEAIRVYRHALSLDPNLFAAHYNLGAALYRLGRYPEAAEAYEAALRLQPAHRVAAANLAHCYRDAGNAEAMKRSMGRAGLVEADLLSPSEWDRAQREIRRNTTPPGAASRPSSSPFCSFEKPEAFIGATFVWTLLLALVLHFALHMAWLRSALLGLAVSAGTVFLIAVVEAEGREYEGGVGPRGSFLVMAVLGTLALHFMDKLSWPVAVLSGALAAGLLCLLARSMWKKKPGLW